MKIFITGGNGMLGRTLQKLWSDKYTLIIGDLPDVDITNYDNLYRSVKESASDVVIHCAAMTLVDLCETEQDKAYLLNEQGSKNVAQVCQALNIRLIAISTDYVFDGDLDRPYKESDTATGGHTVYGQSKFTGENAIRKYCPNHIICRISWLYGFGGPSFVHTMLKLGKSDIPELKVVSDQIGNPTSTIAVAYGLDQLLNNNTLQGTVHLSCEGETSWYGFAQEIFRLSNIDKKLIPCSTEDFPRPAPRPKNSRMEKGFLKNHNLLPMPSWEEALKYFLSHSIV